MLPRFKMFKIKAFLELCNVGPVTMSEVRALGTQLSMLDTKKSQTFFHGYSHYKKQKLVELFTIVSLFKTTNFFPIHSDYEI